MIGVCPVDFENIVTVTKYQKEPENLVVCVFGGGGVVILRISFIT